MTDYEEHTWSATSLLCDKIYQISNAKTYVFADSVLCMYGRYKREAERSLEGKEINGISRVII